MTPIIRAVHLAAALTLMTLLLTSCSAAPETGPGEAAPQESSREAKHAPDGHANAPASVTAVSKFSVYDLDALWYSQDGRTVTLADLAGRPRVIAMVYTSCAYACPRILQDMKRIEGQLRAAGTDAGFVMVSIDPERDTPGRLREYAEATLLDPQDWTLLTGTVDGVLELAALLGVRYRRISATDFEHSNIITLLDADGRIVHRQAGLGAEPGALVHAASGL
jgi:protein SCO1/2